MPMTTFKARVRLSDGSTQKVTVQGDDYFKAKAMLELQYGKGSIVVPPNEVHVKCIDDGN